MLALSSKQYVAMASIVFANSYMQAFCVLFVLVEMVKDIASAPSLKTTCMRHMAIMHNSKI